MSATRGRSTERRMRAADADADSQQIVVDGGAQRLNERDAQQERVLAATGHALHTTRQPNSTRKYGFL